MQMCYNGPNIRKIEALKGMVYIKIFDGMTFKVKAL